MAPLSRFSTLLLLTSGALVLSTPAPTPAPIIEESASGATPLSVPPHNDEVADYPTIGMPVGPEDGPVIMNPPRIDPHHNDPHHTSPHQINPHQPQYPTETATTFVYMPMGGSKGYDIPASEIPNLTIPWGDENGGETPAPGYHHTPPWDFHHPHPWKSHHNHYTDDDDHDDDDWDYAVYARDVPTETLQIPMATSTGEVVAVTEGQGGEGHNNNNNNNEDHGKEGEGEVQGHGLPKPHCPGSFFPPNGHGGEGLGGKGQGGDDHNGDGHNGDDHNGEGHDGKGPSQFPPQGAAVLGADRSMAALVGGLVAALAFSLY